jgi:hypothetical protein
VSDSDCCKSFQGHLTKVLEAFKFGLVYVSA